MNLPEVPSVNKPLYLLTSRPHGLKDTRCINLTGKQFGYWTVKEIDVNRINNRSIAWICRCKCGIERRVLGYNLKNSRSTSCGCMAKQFFRRINHFKWKGFGEISLTKWHTIQNCANRRKIPFYASIKEAWNIFEKQNRKCALSGLPLTFSSRRKSKDENASLDRIDSSKGYEINNIQWVDKRLNIMKGILSNVEFIQLCKLVSINNNF